jgi:hypothetical protein
VLDYVPLHWKGEQRFGQDVEVATLDFEWLAHRLGPDTPLDSVRIVVAPDEELPLGPTDADNVQNAPLQAQWSTGLLPDSVQWDAAGFRAQYTVLDGKHDPQRQSVRWALIGQPRVFPGRGYRVVFYDDMGAPLPPEAQLVWASGRLGERDVQIASLDLGYFAERLGESAKEVTRVSVEPYPEREPAPVREEPDLGDQVGR